MQKVEKEHDTRFQEGEKHLQMDGDVYEDQMDTTRSPQHFQHFQHLQQQHPQQKQQTQGLQAIGLQTEIVETQLPLAMFKPLEL